MPFMAIVGSKVNMNCPHGGIGTVISGSDNVTVDGQPLARKSDIVRCDKCGITRTIDSGSSYISDNGLDFARIGDPTTGICDLKLPGCPHTTTGIITTGSTDFSDG